MVTTRSKKIIGLLMACPLAIGACATGDDGDVSTEGQAEVAVSIVDELESTASSLTEDDTDTDTGTAEGSTTDSEEEPDTAAPATAASAVATITGGPAEFSTDLDNPSDERGFIALDSARTTDRFGDAFAGAGTTLVVIDYQVYFNPGGNFFDDAIRLHADGMTYSPATDINTVGYVGEVLNSTMVFEVPAGTTTAQLEAGLPAGTPGGVTATFDLQFDPSLSYTDPGAGTLTPAEGTIVGEPAPIATDVRSKSGASLLTVTSTRITDREGEFFSHEGTKLVVAEITLQGIEKSTENVFETAFRLKADDEWYSPAGNLNEIIGNGETITAVLVFEVAMNSSTFTLEGGAPAAFIAGVDGFGYERTGNPSASFDLVFS